MGFEKLLSRASIAALCSVAAVTLGVAPSAGAAVYVLNFAGLNGNDEEPVEDYYDGGYGGLGSGPGPNYGITFSSNALACSGQPGGSCNTAEIPGGPGAQVLFFLSGGAATMNVAAGFTTGFSFYYSAAYGPASINVWSGQNDSGTLLATLALPATPDDGDPGCFGTDFCPSEPINVAFAGTAESVDFGGATNEVGFADVTLGSNVAGGVPEPATWSLMLVGFGALGIGLRARRRAASGLAA